MRTRVCHYGCWIYGDDAIEAGRTIDGDFVCAEHLDQHRQATIFNESDYEDEDDEPLWVHCDDCGVEFDCLFEGLANDAELLCPLHAPDSYFLTESAVSMDNIRQLLKTAGTRYNKSLPHYDDCIALVYATHAKLTSESKYKSYGLFTGKPPVDYNVFCLENIVSRPVRPDIYISDQDELTDGINRLTDALSNRPKELSDDECILANRVVYTSVMSVACCYDIWQRGSRKTPGTFFEILMAALLQKMLPAAVFTKHIPLAALLDDSEAAEGVPNDLESVEEDEEEGGSASVSTDLVIGMPDREGGVVIPLKITTRERIVQPFAHQRILDSAFGAGVYNSLLVCISETQLDDKTKSVKQVCVPGTVKLFQKYLAPVGGLYYCDIPQRYFAKDMQKIIPVKSVGDFFKDIAGILDLHGKP